MHVYHLSGKVIVYPNTLPTGKEPPAETHVLSVHLLWPDALDEYRVQSHVMEDLLHGNGHVHGGSWDWIIGPDVVEVDAAGVPGLFCGEVGNV